MCMKNIALSPDILRQYARQHGLRRWMTSVPVLTPRLSSLWFGLVQSIDGFLPVCCGELRKKASPQPARTLSALA